MTQRVLYFVIPPCMEQACAEWLDTLRESGIEVIVQEKLPESVEPDKKLLEAAHALGHHVPLPWLGK